MFKYISCVYVILISLLPSQAATPLAHVQPPSDSKSPPATTPPGTTPTAIPVLTATHISTAITNIAEVAKSQNQTRKARIASIDALARLGALSNDQQVTKSVVDHLSDLLTNPAYGKKSDQMTLSDQPVLRQYVAAALVRIGASSIDAVPKLLAILGKDGDATTDQVVQDAITRILNSAASVKIDTQSKGSAKPDPTSKGSKAGGDTPPKTASEKPKKSGGGNSQSLRLLMRYISRES